MPSFDTYGVDGVHQSGPSLQSKNLVERQSRHHFDPMGQRITDQAPLSSDTGLSEAANSKWIAPADPFRPEPETAYTAQSSPQQNSSLPEQKFVAQSPFPIRNEPQRLNTSTAAVDTFSESAVSTAFSELRRRIQVFLGDQISPIRLASHLAVIAVAAVVLVVSQVKLPDWQFSLRNLPSDGLFANASDQISPTSATLSNSTSEAFQRSVIPLTSQQTQPILSSVQAVAAPAQANTTGLVTAREQIETYSVRSGDTVLGIAAQFNLQPETIQWANPALEANPDMLRIGDRLVILPVDGVLHVVQPGDTLSTIAAKYKVTTEAVVGFGLNQIADSSVALPIGQQLVIPGGNKPYIAKQVIAFSGPVPEGATRGSGSFVWPTSGTITQEYWNGHRAIDVGAWAGTAVSASDSGYVIASSTGWNNGYGNMVMVDHGGGYVTLYSHLNSIFVRQGESVAKGQQIGTVGNTGNSTGPHLHFEVRYQGVARNPFNFLP